MQIGLQSKFIVVHIVLIEQKLNVDAQLINQGKGRRDPAMSYRYRYLCQEIHATAI